MVLRGLAPWRTCSLGSVDRTFILVVEPARGTLRGIVVYSGNPAQTMDRIRAIGLRPHGIAPRNGRRRRYTIPPAAIHALAALLAGFFLFDLRHTMEHRLLF